jgi:cytoskeleton protein RodZ
VFDIGASLAAARRARGLELADAERLTCIRARHLAALERDAFDTLPGRTYARAFLRSYASALGLEADRFVQAFEELVPEPEEDLLPPTPRPRPRLPGARTFATITAAAVAVGFAAWAITKPSRQEHVPGPLAAAAAPAAPQVSHVLGSRHTVAKPQSGALVIRATRGDCWLLVRRGGSAGRVLYEATLRHGHAVRFAARKVWVRFGAPGMVDVRRGPTVMRGLVGTTPTNVVT